MGRGKALILNLALALLLSFPCLSRAWSGKVVGVSDGDTVKVLRDGKQVKIRLYGIDCPEKSQPFSKRAKQFTSDMVFGKEVEIGAITIDHYGRTIALVYVDGTSVNGELVRAGLAWVYYLYCGFPICRE